METLHSAKNAKPSPMLLSASPNIRQLPTDKKAFSRLICGPHLLQFRTTGDQQVVHNFFISPPSFYNCIIVEKIKVYAHIPTQIKEIKGNGWMIRNIAKRTSTHKTENAAQHFRRLMWKIKHYIGNHLLIIIAYSVFVAMTRNRCKTHTHTYTHVTLNIQNAATNIEGSEVMIKIYAFWISTVFWACRSSYLKRTAEWEYKIPILYNDTVYKLLKQVLVCWKKSIKSDTNGWVFQNLS